MKSFIAAASLLLQSNAQDQTSLMQGLVVRRGQIGTESQSERQDASAKLMETATNMIKNGATPDVIGFIEATINEVNDKVLGPIVDSHNIDQKSLDDIHERFDALVAAKKECDSKVSLQTTNQADKTIKHKECRAEESLLCARSRKCEAELEELWSEVKRTEEEMRRIHWAIHAEWCEPGPPPNPSDLDPFHWDDSLYWEGDETSKSVKGGSGKDELRGTDDRYPPVDLSEQVIEFRKFSVEYFGHYRSQKTLVETAWTAYNKKIIECGAAEEVWSLKADACDEKQAALHAEACSKSLQTSQCTSDFGHEYRALMIEFGNLQKAIEEKEYDRKREWETLHIVTCLLETVYTHVIHAIDSGEPCPTEKSNPDQTAAEINYCHVVEESLTKNLTIDYGAPPTMSSIPPVAESPCTAGYIWDESGSFTEALKNSHGDDIADEELTKYLTPGVSDATHAGVSEAGWAACAAPIACIPCQEAVQSLQVDPDYTGHQQCMQHHIKLQPGQMDWHTFKCLDGTECIRAEGRCNDERQCSDGSDEVGCKTFWRSPTLLGTRPCRDPFSSDVQFQCADGATCIDAAARCDGVYNCPDNSDEKNCHVTSTTTGISSTSTAEKSGNRLTAEAMTGNTASFEVPELEKDAPLRSASLVFNDRSYRFDSLGSFAGFSFLKMSNEDKHIDLNHVQVRLRLPKPLTIYVVKVDTDHLTWLNSDGWTLDTNLQGVTYSGLPHDTMHTEWRNGHNWELYDDHVLQGGAEHFADEHGSYARRHTPLGDEQYRAGEVWKKDFPAGVVEMRGNNGGAGSYLVFAANPEHRPVPVSPVPIEQPHDGGFTYHGVRGDSFNIDLDLGLGVETNIVGNQD